MHVWDAIQTKRALREFRAEPLTDDHIDRILNAGRRSQSSKNSQPWHFIAVRDKARLAKLATTGAGMGHVAGCALCVVIVVPTQNERTLWHFFDSGQSAAYMQLAATEIGIGSCLGTIYEPETAAKILGIPDGLQTRLVISFGYPADSSAPAQPLRAGGRRVFDEVVHWETW
ncbi:MAG: nitroreductase family protein [Chloroflexi bacterium]|nr:nitroreductase family protein [Chloroflexota bacterium]